MSPHGAPAPVSGPSTDTPSSRVLVVGATGSVGRHVVAAASRPGLRIRALARDADRARSLLPDVEVVTGDLEDPDSLTAAVRDVDGVVFTHGSGSGAYEQVDYGGVATVLLAALIVAVLVRTDDRRATGSPTEDADGPAVPVLAH